MARHRTYSIEFKEARARLREAPSQERAAATAEVQAAKKNIVPSVLAAAREGRESISSLENEQSAALAERRAAQRWFRREFPAEWEAYQETARAERQTENRLREIAPREWEAYLEFNRP